MRPITDGLKVSREKLAYLVDSTAAPVAALVPVLDLGGLRGVADRRWPRIRDGRGDGGRCGVPGGTQPLRRLHRDHSVPLLSAACACLRPPHLGHERDFGPMARAEARAASGGGILRPGSRPAAEISESFVNAKEGSPGVGGMPDSRWRRWCSWSSARLYTSGRAAAGADASLRDIFGAADPFITLLWGSLSGCLVAAALSIGQRLLDVKECVDAWLGRRQGHDDRDGHPYAGRGRSARSPRTSARRRTSPSCWAATCPSSCFRGGVHHVGRDGVRDRNLVDHHGHSDPTRDSAHRFARGRHRIRRRSLYGILLATTSSVLAGAIWGDHCSPSPTPPSCPRRQPPATTWTTSARSSLCGACRRGPALVSGQRRDGAGASHLAGAPGWRCRARALPADVRHPHRRGWRGAITTPDAFHHPGASRSFSALT